MIRPWKVYDLDQASTPLHTPSPHTHLEHPGLHHCLEALDHSRAQAGSLHLSLHYHPVLPLVLVLLLNLLPQWDQVDCCEFFPLKCRQVCVYFMSTNIHEQEIVQHIEPTGTHSKVAMLSERLSGLALFFPLPSSNPLHSFLALQTSPIQPCLAHKLSTCHAGYSNRQPLQ